MTTQQQLFKKTSKALEELANSLDAGQCEALDKELAPLVLKRGAGMFRLHKSRAGAPRARERSPNTIQRS